MRWFCELPPLHLHRDIVIDLQIEFQPACPSHLETTWLCPASVVTFWFEMSIFRMRCCVCHHAKFAISGCRYSVVVPLPAPQSHLGNHLSSAPPAW